MARIKIKDLEILQHTADQVQGGWFALGPVTVPPASTSEGTIAAEFGYHESFEYYVQFGLEKSRETEPGPSGK